MLKKNKSKNNHISNTVNHLNNKQLKLSFSGSEYTIIKSNHLYEERTQSKQRDQFIDDSRYKQITSLALQRGLNSFRARCEVVVTLANSKKQNYSCTSILLALDVKNNIKIITVVQSYGVKKWTRGFITVKNRINIIPDFYILPRLSKEEILNKHKDKIFNHKSKEQSDEDKIFENYTKHNKLKKV